MDSPDGMPSSVSEYCMATLAELNILVTDAGTPKICDFGHSRFTDDSAKPTVSDLSSKFHATSRYMSPELFTDPKSKPTVFSDVWAYGCVALEILSQLRPYHVITNEHRVSLAIKSGRAPSTKPEFPYAASCLTDTLWGIIKQCWHPHQVARPTSTSLLGAINELIERGQLNPSTSTPLHSANGLDEELLDWPEGIQDYANSLSRLDKSKISMKRMADVWHYFSGAAPPNPNSSGSSQMFAVKVLRAPGGLGSHDFTIDPLQQGLRQAVRERLSIKHQHIIELLGLDTSYGKYPGLVMEFCDGGDLRDALEAASLFDEYFPVRCMLQVLRALRFLHNLPSPLAHGDLTPSNILSDSKGNLKLTLISFARLTANLPTNTQTAAPNDDAISARYLSPELITQDDSSWPTPRADMWSFGCVACWMYVEVDPYPGLKSEHEVISNIIDGAPPYSMAQLSNMGPLGGRHVMPNAPWITNGTLAAILRCWNQDGNQRPTATECLSDLTALLENVGRQLSQISPDVANLTGKVTIPDPPKKKILGHCRGSWRRAFNYKGAEVIDLHYWWWRGMYSPGLFRRSVEVNVKGIRLVPGVLSGDLLDSAKQGIHHELALLRQLKHPNVCTLLGYDDTHAGTIGRPQAPAILTEFCSNGTLGEYCRAQSQNLSFQDRLNLIQGVTNAVLYLHDQVPTGSVVHGNLSTETVLVDRKGIAKLSRFEFACQYEHSDRPMLARVVYSPHIALNPSRWHAPELFNESTDSFSPYPTRYTDLWALGCLLIAVGSIGLRNARLVTDSPV
ncbi:hypothetical protein FRC12_009230 [Ceratobasidium sp. 428]|nr:hypothetical protein FRC12_009230 [Ceratobasidium sp. 428]